MNVGERIKVANDNNSVRKSAFAVNSANKRVAGTRNRASFYELAAPKPRSTENLVQDRVSRLSDSDSRSGENFLEFQTFHICFSIAALSGLIISFFTLFFALWESPSLILGAAFAVLVSSSLVLSLNELNWRIREMTALLLWITASLVGNLAFQSLSASTWIACCVGFSVACLSKTRMPAISAGFWLLIFIGTTL